MNRVAKQVAKKYSASLQLDLQINASTTLNIILSDFNLIPITPRVIFHKNILLLIQMCVIHGTLETGTGKVKNRDDIKFLQLKIQKLEFRQRVIIKST